MSLRNVAAANSATVSNAKNAPFFARRLFRSSQVLPFDKRGQLLPFDAAKRNNPSGPFGAWSSALKDSKNPREERGGEYFRKRLWNSNHPNDVTARMWAFCLFPGDKNYYPGEIEDVKVSGKDGAATTFSFAFDDGERMESATIGDLLTLSEGDLILEPFMQGKEPCSSSKAKPSKPKPSKPKPPKDQANPSSSSEAKPSKAKHAPKGYVWKEGMWRYTFREADIDSKLPYGVVLKLMEILKIRPKESDSCPVSENGCTAKAWEPLLGKLLKEVDPNLRKMIVKVEQTYNGKGATHWTLKSKKVLEDILYGEVAEEESEEEESDDDVNPGEASAVRNNNERTKEMEERRRAVERFQNLPAKKKIGLPITYDSKGGQGNLRDFVVTEYVGGGWYMVTPKGEAKQIKVRGGELHLSRVLWEKASGEILEAEKETQRKEEKRKINPGELVLDVLPRRRVGLVVRKKGEQELFEIISVNEGGWLGMRRLGREGDGEILSCRPSELIVVARQGVGTEEMAADVNDDEDEEESADDDSEDSAAPSKSKPRGGRPRGYGWRKGKWRYVFQEDDIDQTLGASAVHKIKNLLKLRLYNGTGCPISEKRLTMKIWPEMLQSLIDEAEPALKKRLMYIQETYGTTEIGTRTKAALEDILYGRGKEESAEQSVDASKEVCENKIPHLPHAGQVRAEDFQAWLKHRKSSWSALAASRQAPAPKGGGPKGYEWRWGDWRYVFQEDYIDQTLGASAVHKIKELLKLRLFSGSKSAYPISENGLTGEIWPEMLQSLIDEAKPALKKKLTTGSLRGKAFKAIRLHSKAALEDILYGRADTNGSPNDNVTSRSKATLENILDGTGDGEDEVAKILTRRCSSTANLQAPAANSSEMEKEPTELDADKKIVLECWRSMGGTDERLRLVDDAVLR